MSGWTDRSDSRGLFLDCGESTASTASAAIDQLVAVLRQEVFEKGFAVGFDLLLFEVNSDTGRLIAAATSSQRHVAGHADGCSLRLQIVQDEWYDLVESGISDEELSAGTLRLAHRLGMVFRDSFMPHLRDFQRMSSPQGFTYRVLSTTEQPVYEVQFQGPDAVA